MFSTEKTKMCSKFSAASWTLAKSFWESSLPFLSVLVRCTTFARFDLGILAVLWWFVNLGVVSQTFCTAETFLGGAAVGKAPPISSVLQPRLKLQGSTGCQCPSVKQASSSRISRTPSVCFASHSDMLDFMENVQNAFYEASHWNLDNSYGALNITARGRPQHLQYITHELTLAALLDFQIPQGLRLQISSLAAPNFATSYTLGSVGVVDGSVSYLYSSLPLRKEFKSSRIDLENVIRGYENVQELRRPDENWWGELWHAGKRVDRKSKLCTTWIRILG
jgi:hypothetical protein